HSGKALIRQFVALARIDSGCGLPAPRITKPSYCQDDTWLLRPGREARLPGDLQTDNRSPDRFVEVGVGHVRGRSGPKRPASGSARRSGPLAAPIGPLLSALNRGKPIQAGDQPFAPSVRSPAPSPKSARLRQTCSVEASPHPGPRNRAIRSEPNRSTVERPFLPGQHCLL